MVGNRIILKIYIDYVVLNNVTCIYFFKKIDYIMETTQSIKLYIFSKKLNFNSFLKLLRDVLFLKESEKNYLNIFLSKKYYIYHNTKLTNSNIKTQIKKKNGTQYVKRTNNKTLLVLLVLLL
jgi:CRISPR/Cas system CMR subunit Cmr4 (Cas7 group RAMP superfamily)